MWPLSNKNGVFSLSIISICFKDKNAEVGYYTYNEHTKPYRTERDMCQFGYLLTHLCCWAISDSIRPGCNRIVKYLRGQAQETWCYSTFYKIKASHTRCIIGFMSIQSSTRVSHAITYWQFFFLFFDGCKCGIYDNVGMALVSTAIALLEVYTIVYLSFLDLTSGSCTTNGECKQNPSSPIMV